MKRVLICFIAALLLCGCGSKEVKIKDPVIFYYCNKTVSYNSPQSVISNEIREADGLRNSWIALLEFYLDGPTDVDLISPFPEDLTVEAFTILNDQCTLTLSEQLCDLSGIDLTLACTCLSMTVMELTGKSVVEIKTAGSAAENGLSVIMHKDNLLLYGSTAETVPVQE